jgi:hypothetical protein
MSMKLLGIISVVTDQIFYVRQMLEKIWEYSGTVQQLFIDFKKACDSVKREVYNFCLNLV